ncbi:MAG: hypothetical protein JSV03_17125 [Planctomycetota bacterium]|nr:MAG: hypothetical protein JSV03_17125 [Planctomycetota bacterium]
MFGLSGPTFLGIVLSLAASAQEGEAVRDVTRQKAIRYLDLTDEQVAAGMLDSGIKEAEVEKRPYREYVAECVDLLMQHGTDRYGRIHTPMLVNILDVRTRECPELPDIARWPWRGDNRTCFWKPRGADLFIDQSTIEVMYLLSQLTGRDAYKQFADRYLRYAMNLTDEKGFFWWGWHRFYDVFDDVKCFSHGKNHEIHINRPRWEEMWKIDELAVKKEIELIWQWHVIDKKTGEFNRHGNGQQGCDFAMSGGEFVYAFSFLYGKTRDETYLKAAKLVADYHWRNRNPRTSLVPNRPNAGTDRFDGSHFDTSISGLLGYYLLKSYELLGVQEFRDQALSYLRAYAKYGYDAQTGKFWGSLRLDGTPVPGPRLSEGYAQYEPRGHIDLWEPYQLGYEYPIYTAQAYAYAYQLTGQKDMLAAARKWADCIRSSPPTTGCNKNAYYKWYAEHFAPLGTFAGMYGRSISFFVHMYALTGDDLYLRDARRFANQAISKLYYQGLFRGHPAKPYYCAVDGVGFLLYGLLQLDRVLACPDSLRQAKAIPLGPEPATITFDNW